MERGKVKEGRDTENEQGVLGDAPHTRPEPRRGRSQTALSGANRAQCGSLLGFGLKETKDHVLISC